jgi:hypothetical protein
MNWVAFYELGSIELHFGEMVMIELNFFNGMQSDIRINNVSFTLDYLIIMRYSTIHRSLIICVF